MNQRRQVEEPHGEALYNARAATPDYLRIFDRWARDSAAYRAQCKRRGNGRFDVPYGPRAAETLDLFLPSEAAKATLMYVHGGYWSSLDKSDASWIAPAFVDAGYAVAVINYALYPEVSVGAIADQVRAAAAWLYRQCPGWQVSGGRLYACGHSAGGHLATLLLATDWTKFDSSLATSRPVAAAISVSGLYDLVPLLDVPSVAAVHGMEQGAAMQASPARLSPHSGSRLLTALGNDENQGFKQQAAIIAERWAHVHAGQVDCPRRNHFTILDELAQRDGSIFNAALALLSSPHS
ncbi:alpha/beta hydrolase [Pusillimonas noertemannii]|uniref:Arylformamidase n=1 Tax=Pusillimonas noertemannii TaxID=305977 RepID=A0A2U1CH59_9BURK|nr:alpha/beta hydrolase [Pusillimonas noertemannii]NYT70620.1 alpha/beta hydrolase [Pusillimonas noertemannii]PVY60229.1 arylformamidase [Pusillimonas noertemannii]TFL07983.1 alpha/beta hydrolase [Pusillimonas noertemannii]